MPDHRLKPLTPLGRATPQTDTIGPITITENTSIALASLATRNGRETDVARAAKTLNITRINPAANTHLGTQRYAKQQAQ